MKKGSQVAYVLAKVNSVYNWIINATAIVGAAILIFIMFAVCSEIVMRYFFDSPIIWVIEVSEYCLLFLTFLGAGWVLKNRDHISVDIVTRYFKGKTRACIGIVGSLAGVFVSCILVRYGVSVTWEYFLSGSFRPTSLEIPTYLILWVIPFGSFLLLIEFIKSIIKNVKGWRYSQGEEEMQGIPPAQENS